MMIWFITRGGRGGQKVTNPLFVEVNDDNSGRPLKVIKILVNKS